MCSCSTPALGWRFVNPAMKAQYGIDSMGETAENVAAQYGITRDDQDAFALRSQQKAAAARAAGRFAEEIVPVPVPQRKGRRGGGDGRRVHSARHDVETLARLKPAFRDAMDR